MRPANRNRHDDVDNLAADVVEGMCTPTQGWFSADYGQHQPAPVLTYSTIWCLPIRIVTLLLPVENVLALPPAVRLEMGEGNRSAGLVFGDGQERVWFDEQDYVAVHPGCGG